MANEISAKQKTLAASGQAKLATAAGLLQSNEKSRLLSDEEKVSVQAAAAREPWGPLDTATVVFDMLALPSAICTIITSGLKLGVSPDTWPRSVKCASFIGNLMYIAPNYKAWPNADSWPMVMNDICFGLCVIKSGVDNIIMSEAWQKTASGCVEATLDLIWLAPAIGGIVTTDSRNDDDWTLFGANVAFDIAGILTPVVQKYKKVFIAQMVLTGCYGVLGAATGGIYLARRLK